MSTAIVWFRRDLRLDDNPALTAAAKQHDAVVCVYIHAPEEEAPWSPGASSRWWLHHSLTALETALARQGASLHIRRGPTIAAFDSIVRATGAVAVYWNRLYEPAVTRRDRALQRNLESSGVEVHTFNANLLIEPWQVETGSGGPYRVFTPFWRNVRARLAPRAPGAAPRRLRSCDVANGESLDALRLLPTIGWDGEFRDHWHPGERGAKVLLRRFRERVLASYSSGRDRPDDTFTSRLSPHLHFGEIGPRQILWELSRDIRRGSETGKGESIDAFLRELGWREFAHHLLHHFPRTPQANLDARFDAFPWERDDGDTVGRWQRGETGIPIVDAGMRQLWKSGWMHNRVRMLVASFLTKNLRQHWLAGARWFWDTLVDADLASNTLGWQWSAGCGADAAPYFRIFNPVAQAERFDPDGDYVRRWVPELKALPATLIHRPWTMQEALRQTAYPPPMVDLAASREAALSAHARMRARRTGTPKRKR